MSNDFPECYGFLSLRDLTKKKKRETGKFFFLIFFFFSPLYNLLTTPPIEN